MCQDANANNIGLEKENHQTPFSKHLQYFVSNGTYLAVLDPEYCKCFKLGLGIGIDITVSVLTPAYMEFSLLL